nr:M1 family metallopeptidase [Bacteroidota bacterium]
MRILFSAAYFATLFIASIACAQPLHCFHPDEVGGPREHNIDVEHLLLEIKFNPMEKLVTGKATHTFTPLHKAVDTIFLDAPGIRFSEVKLDGADARYTTSSKGITIYPATPLAWNTRHLLTMTYEANPKRGLYFIGWDDTTGRSRKQIWTQGQGIDNRHWIPGFDDPNDKLISEVVVTFDSKYKVLSNGAQLKPKTNKDGTTTWHYRMTHPHALYLIMLGIGDYAIQKSASQSGVPLNAYYYPDQPQALEPSYRYTADIMDFFESEIMVPYPWKSYSQIPVQEFLYGAMENTSATVFGDFFMVDSRGFLDRNYVGVNAHEMAHQWFGDMVTAKSVHDLWLQESFATHYAKLAEKHLFGTGHYLWNKRNEQNSALNASLRDLYPIYHSKAGSPRIYPKGSFVLDMLKYVVGREQYNRVVAHYLKQHAYGNVTTFDFMDAFHDVLGINLDWFFNQWIYNGGE